MSYKKVDFEFAQRLYLGGRISHTHKVFKDLAKLGYEEAEMYAMLIFWDWLNNNGDKSLEEQMKKAVELLGMAHFLPHTKELTRLSMILGDTRKRTSWK